MSNWRRPCLLIAAVLVALETPSLAADRSSLVGDANRSGFDAGEEARLRAASSGEDRAVRALAEFYAAHALWPETLAALARLQAPGALDALLAVEAEYRFGRYRRAALRADAVAEARAFNAMALVRLGAYARAAALLAGAVPPAGLEADFHLAAAEALLETGDTAGAASALRRAGQHSLSGDDAARLRFLHAALDRLTGAAPRAEAAFRRLAQGPVNDWSMRARLALDDAPPDFDALSLMWRSDAVDRILAMARGQMHLAKREFSEAFAAYASVTARHPQSDSALVAQEILQQALARLFEEEAALPAEKAARLFFEYVEFAPPGREGDRLIRQVAERLKSLGLAAQAALLLDHQVFKRLRGADRARVAAELADLHLASGAPDAALRALRSTRIAGLSDDIRARRRRLEATALAARGDREAALALLGNADARDDVRLRASVNWDSERWSAAAQDYSSLFAASAGAPGAADRDMAVRAATAFLLAGDRAGYRAFVNGAGARLSGSAEGALIQSLGDVDRDAFLGDFMESYRALYPART